MGEILLEMRISEEVDKAAEGKPEGTSTFLVPFFNFFYYFLLVPFKITLDPEKQLYQLKSCLTVRIICAFAHLLVFVMFSYTTVLTLIFLLRNKEPALVLALNLISNLSALAAYVIIMNLLWCRQQDFLKIIEHTRVKRLVTVHKARVIIGLLIYATIFFLFASINITNWVAINDENYFNLLSFPITMDPIHSGNMTFIGYQAAVFGKQNRICNGILLCLILYTSMFYLTIQGILLALSLTLGQLGKHFAVQINDTSESEAHACDVGESIAKGIACYRKLKEICEEVSRVYGAHLMAYYVTSVSYYAEAPHVLLGRRGNIERTVLAYFVVSGVVWIVAAEFHHYVRKTMQKWIRVNSDRKLMSLEDRLKLLAITNEVSSDPIALSSKYFRVTYSHIGTMVGLILTYGIIVCQLYHNNEEGS